jgi:hypothetical protein
MRKLNTQNEVIEALGGLARVRELLEANRKQAWHWTKTGVFPAYTYPVLAKALKRRRLAVSDDLFAGRKPAS